MFGQVELVFQKWLRGTMCPPKAQPDLLFLGSFVRHMGQVKTRLTGRYCLSGLLGGSSRRPRSFGRTCLSGPSGAGLPLSLYTIGALAIAAARFLAFQLDKVGIDEKDAQNLLEAGPMHLNCDERALLPTESLLRVPCFGPFVRPV